MDHPSFVYPLHQAIPYPSEYSSYPPQNSPKPEVKRKQVGRACAQCAAAHVACSEHRPCTRCAKRGIVCLDRERKRRRRMGVDDEDDLMLASSGLMTPRHMLPPLGPVYLPPMMPSLPHHGGEQFLSRYELEPTAQQKYFQFHPYFPGESDYEASIPSPHARTGLPVEERMYSAASGYPDFPHGLHYEVVPVQSPMYPGRVTAYPGYPSLPAEFRETPTPLPSVFTKENL